METGETPAGSLTILDLKVKEFWLLDDARVFGGGQGAVLRLAGFISAAPASSVRVLCPSRSELAERCRAAEIPVLDVKFPDLDRHLVRIVRAVLALRQTIRGANTDSIVVAASLRTQIYVHAALLGRRQAPKVVHLMLEQDSARRLTARMLLRRKGAVVVVGDAAADAYAERLVGVHVTAVNNFLSSEELIRASRRPRPPLARRAPKLGVLARLIPEKGVLELVDELASDPTAWSTLRIGGDLQDASYARTIEHRVRALELGERVQFAGRIHDLQPFFDEIDALVVPSIGHEGQPTVIIEALAFGCPCIVRGPLWSEEFRGMPVAAYRDSATLLKALRELPTEAVSRELLLERFSPGHVVDALETAAGGDV